MRETKDLQFTKSHEWIDMIDDTSAYIGLTDYAQSELGELVFINLPDEGDELNMGESMADVESVKAVSDVFSPVTGVVAEFNEDLLDAPEMVNESPYEAWFVKAENISELEDLMDEDEYMDFVDKEREE